MAMAIGIDAVLDTSGPEILLDRIRQNIFPVARHESKHFDRHGNKTRGGVFARQASESM